MADITNRSFAAHAERFPSASSSSEAAVDRDLRHSEVVPRGAAVVGGSAANAANDDAQVGGATTKERVFATFYDEFAALGFERTSLRQVSKRLGINAATVHYHWSGKTDLWTRCCERAIDEIATIIDEATSGPDGVRLSEEAWLRVVGALAADPRPVQLIDWALRAPSPERERAMASLRRLAVRCGPLVDELKRSVDPGIDLEAELWLLVVGLVTLLGRSLPAQALPLASQDGPEVQAKRLTAMLARHTMRFLSQQAPAHTQ